MTKHWTILTIRDGQIQNPNAVKKLFDQLKDGKVKLEATPINQRSLPQNAYLHGVLIPEFRNALNSVGYAEVKTDGQSKEIIKRMFLTQRVVNEITGECLDYTQRTSELTKEQMTILIDEVIRFAAENMSYVIPLPSEQLMMNYE